MGFGKAKSHGIALTFSGLLVGRKLEWAAILLDRVLNRLPGAVGGAALDEDQLGGGAHEWRPLDSDVHVARFVARGHDHAHRKRLGSGACIPPAQGIEPIEREALQDRQLGQIAIDQRGKARHRQGKQQTVLETNHLEAGDVEQVVKIAVRQPVRGWSRGFPTHHLRRLRGKLPKVVEGGQIDQSMLSQAIAQALQPGAHVRHRVTQTIADHGIEPSPGREPFDLAHLEADLRMATLGLRRQISRGGNSHPFLVGQSRNQVTGAAAHLHHRRVGGDPTPQSRAQILIQELASSRMARLLESHSAEIVCPGCL